MLYCKSDIFNFTNIHLLSSTLEIILNMLSHILLCKLCISVAKCYVVG